jgi:hypothetical protein
VNQRLAHHGVRLDLLSGVARPAEDYQVLERMASAVSPWNDVVNLRSICASTQATLITVSLSGEGSLPSPLGVVGLGLPAAPEVASFTGDVLRTVLVAADVPAGRPSGRPGCRERGAANRAVSGYAPARSPSRSDVTPVRAEACVELNSRSVDVERRPAILARFVHAITRRHALILSLNETYLRIAADRLSQLSLFTEASA